GCLHRSWFPSRTFSSNRWPHCISRNTEPSRPRNATPRAGSTGPFFDFATNVHGCTEISEKDGASDSREGKRRHRGNSASKRLAWVKEGEKGEGRREKGKGVARMEEKIIYCT